MRDESGKSGFLQLEEFENLSSVIYFLVIFGGRISESIIDKKGVLLFFEMFFFENKVT